jgi:hypothetical protein
MDEGRKRVLLIAASILAARKLAHSSPPPRSPAFEAAIADALSTAERILTRIDERFPASGLARYKEDRMQRALAVANLVGLVSGTIGGILLVFAFSATSSRYKFVETSDHGVVICHDDKLVSAGYGGGFASGEPCPRGIGPSVAAVVESERPALVRWGLVLIVFGFVLQLVPSAVATGTTARAG